MTRSERYGLVKEEELRPTAALHHLAPAPFIVEDANQPRLGRPAPPEQSFQSPGPTTVLPDLMRVFDGVHLASIPPKVAFAPVQPTDGDGRPLARHYHRLAKRRSLGVVLSF